MLSIITPTLNSGHFLKQLLNSIDELDFPLEHIVVDGGSTDNTMQIVKSNPCVRCLRQQTQDGMYAAIQEGFTAAQGPFITWINSDDWILPKGYTDLYNLMATNRYDLAYGAGFCQNLQTNQQNLFAAKRFGKFLMQNGVLPCLQPATIYTKAIFNKINGFNPTHFKIAGDIDFFMRLSQASATAFARTSLPSVVFLKHGNSLGDNNHATYLKEKKRLPRPKYGAAGQLLAKVTYKLS